MRTWTIPRQIIVGFSMLVLLTMFLGVIALIQIVSVEQNVRLLASNGLPSVVVLNKISEANAMASREIRRELLQSNQGQTKKNAESDANKNIFQILKVRGDEFCATYESLISDNEDRRLFSEFGKMPSGIQCRHCIQHGACRCGGKVSREDGCF